MRWPVDKARVTPHGGYLYDRSKWKRGGVIHPGLDLAGNRGTPVYAPEDGEVVDVWRFSSTARKDYAPRHRPWNGYGPGGVLIRGKSGVYHVLAHLQNDRLRAIGPVREGEIVGYISGLNHVHWEARTAAHGGKTLSPESLISTGPAGEISRPRRSAGASAVGAAAVAALFVIALARRGKVRR